MKRFSFRLGPILKLRQHHLQNREMELARASAAVLEIREQQEELLRAKARYQSRVLGGPLDGEKLQALQHFNNRNLQQQQKASQELEKALQAEDAAREAYKEALKQKKVLDKLKEKQQGRFYKAQLDEEEKNREDMNILGFRYKTST